MKKLLISNKQDPGEIVAYSHVVENVKFQNCVLSMAGANNRSKLKDCEFKDIGLTDCSVGHPIFENCKFKNIIANETVTLYESLFIECFISGKIRNLNFGKIKRDGIPFFSEARYLEDAARLEDCAFSIDITTVTDMDECGFIGDVIARKIRFKKGQGLLLKGERLDLVFRPIIKSITDNDFGIVVVGPAGFGKSYNLHFCAIPTRVAHKADEYASIIRSYGVEVYEEPLI